MKSVGPKAGTPVRHALPALSWSGGKGWLVPHLLELVSGIEHRCYVELFAGGAALLAAKEPSPVEALNDIHGELVNTYRCAKYHAEELERELDWTLHSREQHADYKGQEGLTDIQRAARWFWRCHLGGGFGPDSYGRSKAAAPRSRVRRLDLLRAFGERLDRVYVENLHWEKAIQIYDGAETLFFADPPYHGLAGSTYGAWGEQQIRAFAERIRACSGRWIVTLNDTPLVREAFEGCAFVSVSRNAGIDHRATARRRGEVIITPNR